MTTKSTNTPTMPGNGTPTLSAVIASAMSLSNEDKFSFGGSLLITAGVIIALTGTPRQDDLVSDETYAARQIITHTPDAPNKVALQLAQK